jgi:hypothetical protein
MIDQDTEQNDRFSLGKKKRTSSGEAVRVRNLAQVSALWSPAVVKYYEWEDAARGHMKLLRACALNTRVFGTTFACGLTSCYLRGTAMQQDQDEGKLWARYDFNRTSTLIWKGWTRFRWIKIY